MLLRFLSPDWPARPSGGRLFPWLIILGCAVLLLPVLYVGIYNQPCPADDFGNSDWSDFFGAQKTMYLHWSGRYFNNLVLLLCPLHWHSFAGYRWLIIGLMLALILVFSMLVFHLLRMVGTTRRLNATAIGLAASLLVINNMESLAEGFFWYAGAFTYTVPALLFMLFLLLARKIDSGRVESPGILSCLCAAVLVACTIGGNETMMLLCDVTVFALLLYYRHSRQRRRYRFYSFLCMLCLICSIVAVFAPGNMQRQAVNPRILWMVFPTWIYHSQKLAAQWILDPFFLLFSFCVLLLNLAPVRRPASLLHSFLLPFALLFLLSFPGHYGLGTAPPPRIDNIIYLFFVAGWIFFLLQLSHYLRNRPGAILQTNAASGQLAAVVAIMGLLVSFNTHDFRNANVFKVAKGLAKKIPQRYYSEVNDRFRLIKSSPLDSVAVPDLIYKKDNVLYLADIIPRASSSSNRSLARYCGKAAVFIAPDSVVYRRDRVFR